MGGITFNLVHRPWIPVEDLTGNLREVSLNELFRDSHQIRRITDQSPVVTAALYRLVFAIGTRAVAPMSEEDWEVVWEEGDIREEVLDYLKCYEERFDLFSNEAPFYQTLGMPENCRDYSWTKLALELPPNSTKLLFDHTSTTDPPIATPEVVARALVAAQAYLVGAGKSCLSYTSNAPLTAAISVIPEGPTLNETLLANLQSGSGEDDLAAWEAAPLTADAIQAQTVDSWQGPASRLTWPSRAVRIIPEDETGAVKWIQYAMGFKTPAIDGDTDPWVSYVVKKDGSRAPRKLDLNKMLWRDVHALIGGGGEEADAVGAVTRLGLLEYSDRQPPRSWNILVVGVHADKASIKAWRQERWKVPTELVLDGVRYRNLRAGAEEAERFGDQVDKATWFTAAKLMSAREHPAKTDITKLANSLPTKAAYWTLLEGRFQAFLNDLAGDVNLARDGWRRSIAAAVREAERATHAAIGRTPAALKAWALAGQRFAQIVYEIEESRTNQVNERGEVNTDE